MLKELLVELIDKPIVVDENPLIYQRKLMQRWQNKKLKKEVWPLEQEKRLV